MIYELKCYQATKGKFEVMRDRFLNEAAPRLAQHGVTVIAAFQELSEEPRLFYITCGEGPETLAAGWAAFGSDPDWKEIKQKSEVDGPLLSDQSGLHLIALEPFEPFEAVKSVRSS